MKRRIFWSVFFTVFFRLPIYESIAAIFWQSCQLCYGFVCLSIISAVGKLIFTVSVVKILEDFLFFFNQIKHFSEDYSEITASGLKGEIVNF